MSPEKSNDFIHTNNEYEKLKKDSTDQNRTPRETPASQGPGRSGYDKQLFDEWTTEELAEYASKLGVTVDDGTTREDLLTGLKDRDATLARSS